MFRFRKILCPVDFFPASIRAFHGALGLAEKYKASLHVMHAIPPVFTGAYDVPIGSAELVAALEKDSRRRLERLKAVSGKYRESLLLGVEEKLKALVAKAGVKQLQIDAQVATGRPFRVIPGILQRGKYDLLVMNIHGKTLLDRALIGSTAERVVRAVSNRCPVLLIPPSASAASRNGRTKKK